MRYVKWSLLSLLALLVLSVFHYTLPQRDIVRVVNTEVQRIDPGVNSLFWASPDVGSDGTAINRDVRFIETIRPGGSPMVYRNEDTGWGWPPYFKFNSADLQARARDLVSTQQTPRWVAVTHYGWRNDLFTIYPNATNVQLVDSPDQFMMPWFNIIFFILLAAFLFWLWRLWVRFRERRIDPVLEDASEAWDDVEDRAAAARGWFGRQIDRFFRR